MIPVAASNAQKNPKKANIYEQNAASISSAVSMGVAATGSKDQIAKKKKKIPTFTPVDDDDKDMFS